MWWNLGFPETAPVISISLLCLKKGQTKRKHCGKDCQKATDHDRLKNLRMHGSRSWRSFITGNRSNPSSRKNLDLRPHDRPYKVLLLANVANCIAGTISAITWWKGEGEGNAQVRFQALLGYHISVRQVCARRHWQMTMKYVYSSTEL